MTLQTLSSNTVYQELLDPENEAAMSHIELARWADVILIAPATAHIIAKLAHGLADDLLSTLSLVTTAPIILVPAMNQQMWLAAATQDNLELLKRRNVLFWGPDEGLQACGEDGPGRMLEPDDIVQQLNLFTSAKQCLAGKNVLITLGPTQEAIDPVRFISNRSSGKMGYALAQAAVAQGANVTIVSGPVAIAAPSDCICIMVKTAQEMLQAVEDNIVGQDVFISAAAVADYYVIEPALNKIKKHEAVLTLTFDKTPDILMTVRQKNPNLFLVGFAAETENLMANAQEKYVRKGVNLMVLNDVSNPEIGFESDHNAVTILSQNGSTILEKASKIIIAKKIMEVISENL
jgi:phosphopantothenoylcysteine decarboxylase/phosphopantothenate--cysteine ligase